MNNRRMKIFTKAAFGVLCSAVFCVGSAMTCFAQEETAAAGDGQNYGKAGIVWMIKDYWDHRNTIESEPLDEFENNVISCTHTDVNITGNGQYEVILEGYHVVEDQIPFVSVGTLGVEFAMDFASNAELSVTLDECTIDGVTYTFNEQPELEDSELGKVMKVKNAYGDNAKTTPEMDASPWTTIDPITIKFTVSGLDQEKIADNPDEKIVTAYGNGSIENDPSDEEVASAAQESTEGSEQAASAESSKAEESSSAESSSDDSQKAEAEESSNNWIIYVCIAGGVVVIIIVIAIIAKKKN